MSDKATAAKNGTPNDEETAVKSSKPPRYQGFLRRQEAEEKELAALEAARSAEPAKASPDEEGDPATSDDDLSAEEKTFKQRYGDLRRHLQTIQDTYKKESGEKDEELVKLRRQLEEADTGLPSSEEELQAFMAERPDVARIFKRMIAKEMQKKEEELDQRFQSIEERESKNALETARLKLKKRHPDLDDLQESEEFHAWVMSRSKKIQAAIYDNPEDWEAADDIITMYKFHQEQTKPKPRTKKKEEAEEAATDVRVPSGKNELGNSGAPKFRESDIQKMSAQEFENLEEEISKAMASGNVIMDVSGGAR